MGTLREQRIKEEDHRMRKLRRIVDMTCALLRQLPLTKETAHNLITATRKLVLELFPNSEKQFDLIYLPRFYRILRERNILTEN